MSSLRDREMILSPKHWPLIVLPLKRANPFQDGNKAVFALPLNVVEVKPDEPIEIRIGTMFRNLSELPVKRYENVDALLADGWEVD